MISFRYFKSCNFVSPWIIFDNYALFKNSHTKQYLFWSNLSAITVVFSWYAVKVFRKWSEGKSIFSKLQVYENIHEGFSFSVTLKADFCNNFLLHIFSLVESWFIEIRSLLSVTLQKELPQVRFLGISRKILFRGVFKPSQTSKINVIAKIVFLNALTIFSESFILDVLLSCEFFSALTHNSR